MNYTAINIVKSHKIHFLLFFAFFHYQLFSQNFSWIKSAYRTDCNNGVYPTDVATDKDGNVISTGYYYSTIGNPIRFSDSLLEGYTINSFESNTFIAKYNATGKVKWIKRIGTNENDGTYPRVATDDSGNVFATVGLNGLTNGSSGFIDNTPISSVLPNDAVLTKFTSTGILNWYKHFRGTEKIAIYDVKADSIGNAYVTGAFNGLLTVDNTTINGAPGLNTNFFIVKFNSSGNLIWFKNATGTGSDAGYRLYLKGNDVYVLGVFADGISDADITLDGVTYTIPNTNYDATFVAKYSSNGTLTWFRYGYLQDNGGSVAPPNYCDIVVDSSNSVYTIYSLSHSGTGINYTSPGSIINYTCTGTGGADYLMSKYNSNGTLLWAKGDGGSTANNYCFPTSMIINSNNQLFVSYIISSSVEIDNVSILSASSEDAIVGKFDLNGSLKCYKQYGGTNQDWPLDMEPSVNGSVAYTGHVYGGIVSSAITSYNGIPIIGCRNTGITGLMTIPVISYNSPMCANTAPSTVTFSGTTFGAFSSSPAGLIVDSTTGTITPIGSLPGTYTVSMSDVDCNGIINTTVSIMPPLTTVLNPVICNGDGYFLPGPGPIVYVSGTYTDTLISTGGCDSTILINLTVLPPINKLVGVTGATLTAQENTATYQWVDCMNSNALIPGAMAKFYKASNSGNYAVIITKDGCTDTSECYPIQTIGINETDFTNTIQLFPNPGHDNITINFNNSIKNATIRLYNTFGQMITQENNFSGNRFIMNLSKYSSGVYFIEINSNTKTAKMKLVKE